MAYQKEEPQALSRGISNHVQGKKTVIIGATPNPDRYAHIAAKRLIEYHHTIVPVGIRKGEVEGKKILNLKERPGIQDVDTVTLYINPSHQREWEEYMLNLHPKRIIFNPGTENPPFAAKAQGKGIETLNACTLVMLSVGNY